MTTRFVVRVRLITLLVVCIMLVIVGRLYYLQVMRGAQYVARADAQFDQPASPLLDRGLIYFTDKNNVQIVAGTMRTGFGIAINPTKITNPAAVYAVIKDYIPLTYDQFLPKAQKPNNKYQLLAGQLDESAGALIQKNLQPGIILQADRWRFYPGGSLAAQELGFVAYKGDSQVGRYGLERYYENNLTRAHEDLYNNFFVELFGGVKSVLSGEPQEGDLITTIEPSVQAELERELVAYTSAWHPKLAGGVIMDPQTGEIYAMAVNPTFDLNDFHSQTDPLIFANPMVENDYEMGSIIKPLTMAAGIDSGAITASSTYNDTGCMTVDKKTFCNYDLRARGITPMQQILSQSLNMGAAYIATQMGSSTMRKYFLDHYKLNQETGIDLPGEIHGLTDNLKSTRSVEYDTASFGQGIAITPIETVRALALLANGGKLVTPHLVSAIRYQTGITKSLGWAPGEQVLKPETAMQVTQMLTTVVDTALANGKDKLEHYSVAAKTGTAQIANPNGGGYYADKYLHSFFGYFPSYNARFIVFLFAVEPVGAKYASETWAPPFHSLTQFLINYYDIPPDR